MLGTLRTQTRQLTEPVVDNLQFIKQSSLRFIDAVQAEHVYWPRYCLLSGSKHNSCCLFVYVYYKHFFSGSFQTRVICGYLAQEKNFSSAVRTTSEARLFYPFRAYTPIVLEASLPS